MLTDVFCGRRSADVARWCFAFVLALVFVGGVAEQAQAQTFDCAILKHWRNDLHEGVYGDETPEPLPDARVVLDFSKSVVVRTKGSPPVAATILTGRQARTMMIRQDADIILYTLYGSKDGAGAHLGSALLINDNDYMPRGSMMSRLACRKL